MAFQLPSCLKSDKIQRQYCFHFGDCFSYYSFNRYRIFYISGIFPLYEIIIRALGIFFAANYYKATLEKHFPPFVLRVPHYILGILKKWNTWDRDSNCQAGSFEGCCAIGKSVCQIMYRPKPLSLSGSSRQ